MSFEKAGIHIPHVLHLADEVGIDTFGNRNLNDQDGAVAELQDRYYPDAWMLASTTRPINERPHYRVICKSPSELALAYALRPQGVTARIVLGQE
jgi:hypothetical protein